ncbi:MAG: hypothetical protein GY953_22075, partial [bacterium]|nr:hypothetical protein [bacterium]
SAGPSGSPSAEPSPAASPLGAEAAAVIVDHVTPIVPVARFWSKADNVIRADLVRALETGKPVVILVRTDIWNQQRVFAEARKQDRTVADSVAKALDVPGELLDFLEYVLEQKRRNWIRPFGNATEAVQILRDQLPSLHAEDRRTFIREVASLLILNDYRGFTPKTAAAREASFFVAEFGDPELPFEVAVHCSFQPNGKSVEQADIAQFLEEFAASECDQARIVTNTGFAANLALPRKVKPITRQDLLARLVDFSSYVERVRSDYFHYTPGILPQYIPLRADLRRYFVPLGCEGDYTGDLFG